ncbi:MAG: hypothetical protein K2M19_09450 [Muribaculaceae bacterium]|nr:hypothetical protein [Muribaculaceae bacterium]
MIRFLVVILISVVVSFYAWSQEPERGYRGFLDANVDLQFEREYNGNNTTTVFYGISTTHGYQFNHHFFLGGGLMVERNHPYPYDNSLIDIPFFVQARTDWTFGQVPLYGDLRVGGIVFGEYRIFISPTVGYRHKLGKKSSFNFGIGMNLRGCSWSDEKTFHPQLALRVGIDF